MKRYTPGIEQPHPELEAVAFMMEAKHGECVMHADHAAFVARVREIAERGAVCSFVHQQQEMWNAMLEVCNG